MNITLTVDNPNLPKMSEIIDPYCMLRSCYPCSYIFAHIDYFDRYKKTKILQIQSAGDEFFLPDNEVERSQWI
jgi:PhoPQ-activated pathogenicity-related protein